jgi:hypothetical protein
MSYKDDFKKLFVGENATFGTLKQAAELYVKQIRAKTIDGALNIPACGLAIPCDHDKKNECNIGLFMEFLKEELNKYYKEWLTSITCKYRQYHWEIIVEIHKGVQEI